MALKIAALLALSAPALVASIMPPYIRATYQHTVVLPRKGSTTPSSNNMLFVAEEGHNAERTQGSICGQIERAFEAANYMPKCQAEVGTALRHARGLAMQHDSKYADAVYALESKLALSGFLSRDFETTLFQKPYRANFLLHLARGGVSAGAKPAAFKTVCDVGFGAGHSALWWLVERPDVTVYSFDVGLTRYFTAAHDYLDETYPNRLMLFSGDSTVTAKHVPSYFPDATCDIVYIDGSRTYNGTTNDLTNFRALASPEHIVILVNGGAASDAGRAWAEAASSGVVEWEGTVLESLDRPEGEALQYGRFKPAAK